MHLRLKAGILAGVVVLATWTTAGTASADIGPVNNNVHATVTIAESGESMTITGFSPTVAFGTVHPGDVALAPSAEVIHFSTDHPAGVTLSMQANSGGFAMAMGQPVVIRNDALTINTAITGDRLGNSNLPLNEFGPTVLASVVAGDYQASQNWFLSIPADLTAIGDLQADFTETFTANP